MGACRDDFYDEGYVCLLTFCKNSSVDDKRQLFCSYLVSKRPADVNQKGMQVLLGKQVFQSYPTCLFLRCALFETS